MKETNSKIEQLIKINNDLDNKFKAFVFEAEKSPQNASLLAKATAMKHKCVENKDVKKLEGVLKLLEQKGKVEVEYNWNYIHIDSCMFCYFNYYNRLMPFFAFILHFVASLLMLVLY